MAQDASPPCAGVAEPARFAAAIGGRLFCWLFGHGLENWGSRVCSQGKCCCRANEKGYRGKITIDRIIYRFPHMTGDARRRSRALSRIANIVGLHSADFLRAPTPESRNCQVRAQLDLWLAEKAIS